MSLKNICDIGKKNYSVIIISILTLLAFLLRFYHLDYNSLWEDEITTTIIANLDISGIFERIFIDVRPTPPLFYVLEHLMLTMGTGDWILRFVPAIFGTLTIPLIYLIGKELLNKNGGLIAATLLTVSVFHLWYSQEARCYSTLIFIFLIAVYFYIRAYKTNYIIYWIFFGFFSAMAFWCHFYILIGIALCYIHAIVINIHNLNSRLFIRNISVSAVVSLILVFPLIIAGFSIISTQLNPIQPGLTGVFTAPYAIYKMLTWNWNVITLLNCIQVIIYCILALCGWILILKKSMKHAILIGLFLILPPIISIILSQVFGLAIWQQYLAFMLPFILLAISGMVYVIPNQIDVNKITIGIICGILILSICYLPMYYSEPTKSEWKTAYHELEKLTADGDTVVLFSEVNEYENPYYYYNPKIDNVHVINTVSSIEDLEEKIAVTNSSNIYFIFSWSLVPKNITAITPSGSAYLDKIIGNYYATTELGRGNPELNKWLRNNTDECASFSYFGPYRDIQIRKITKT